MAQVLSDTPGRLRVRLRPERRHSRFMARVSSHFAGRDGIAGVDTNARTGSVTVRYDPKRHSSADMLDLLHDLGVVAESVTSGEDLPDPGSSTTADSVMGALDDLDARLSRFTGHTVDLKLAFPLALGGLGVYQLMRNGFELAEVPGYVLIWYAFDSFFKLHVQRQPHRAATQAAGEAADEAAGAARAAGRAG